MTEQSNLELLIQCKGEEFLAAEFAAELDVECHVLSTYII